MRAFAGFAALSLAACSFDPPPLPPERAAARDVLVQRLASWSAPCSPGAELGCTLREEEFYKAIARDFEIELANYPNLTPLVERRAKVAREKVNACGVSRRGDSHIRVLMAAECRMSERFRYVLQLRDELENVAR